MIPLTRPLLGAAEQAAVAQVLDSGMLVQGEQVAAFEAAVAAQTGRRHAIAVSSGTGALELALAALDVGAGDEVLCPDLSWPSPAHAILARGATPALVDVDAAEWNATPEALAAARDERTRAAILIDQFGNPSRVAQAAKALDGLPLIVDAACSLGSHIGGTPCGALGLIACSSFHPRKVITTGEGGMCLTDDDALAERLRVLRNHGQSAPGQFAGPAGNYRMTEMAGAMGVVQMGRLQHIVQQRRALSEAYLQALPELGLQLQQEPDGGEANRQTLGVLLPQGWDEDRRGGLIEALRARGVQAGLLSFAIHELPHMAPWAKAARAAGRELSVASDIARRGMALPLFPHMGEQAVAEVIDALRDLLP
jgi:perosamine synthetase